MRAVIFTDESSTTTDERDDVKMREYYRGNFLSVATLADDLSELGTVDLHILSDRFGHVRGDDLLSEQSAEVEGEEYVEEFRNALLNAADDADVIGVFLKNGSFNKVVSPVWSEAVDAAQPKAIWFVALSPTGLRELDLERLREKGCEVVTYERVGVARVGTDAREELLGLIESRQTVNR